MEALKAIKIIGNQNDGRAVFLFLPNTGRALLFSRCHGSVKLTVFGAIP